MNENNFYTARLKQSKSGRTRLRIYDSPRKMKQQKNNDTSDVDKTSRHTRPERVIMRRNRNRTIHKLYDLIDNNMDEFKSFITLTFADEIDNYDVALDYLTKYIRKLQYGLKKCGEELKHITVPEIQQVRAEKTGKQVIHFHMLTNLETGSFFIPKREHKRFYSTEKQRWIHMDYYDLPQWKHGFSSALPIHADSHVGGLVNYLKKYLTKSDSNHFFGRRKILYTQNLAVSKETYFSNDDEILDVMEQLAPYQTECFVPEINAAFMPEYVEYVYELGKEAIDIQ